MTDLRFAIGSSSLRPAMHVQAFGPSEDAMTDIRPVHAHPKPGPDCTLNRALIDQMTDLRLAANMKQGSGKLDRSMPPGAGMTDVRLAASTHPNHMHQRALGAGNAMTDVRLSASVNDRGARPMLPTAFAGKEPPTTDVRLVGAAWDGANDQIATGIPATGAARPLPALLVSYAYWQGFAKYRARYAFRDYMLDSGAYSVHTTGASIDLAAFIAFCQEAMATDPQCVEIIQLDVLHDWHQGQKNLQRMWDAGVPAIPVWHWNEPLSLLEEYASAAPKIAVGVREKSTDRKRTFYEQVFARVWPCRIHGLAIGGPALLRALPFHSADATNWILGPAGYGAYKSIGKPGRAPRGKAINLRSEVEWWLKLERELKQRWASALAEIDRARPAWPLRTWPAPRAVPEPVTA